MARLPTPTYLEQTTHCWSSIAKKCEKGYLVSRHEEAQYRVMQALPPPNREDAAKNLIVQTREA